MHVVQRISRQRDQEGKNFVFTKAPNTWSGLNRNPGYVVTFMDKALYDDYLCLVALNKKQI